MRNTVAFCALRAGLYFGTKRNRLVICVFHAVFLDRGLLCFFVHFAQCFIERGILSFFALYVVLLERRIL